MAYTFSKRKTYKLADEGWILKYIKTNIDGSHDFEVISHNDPEYDWAEYTTKDGSEVIAVKGIKSE